MELKDYIEAGIEKCNTAAALAKQLKQNANAVRDAKAQSRGLPNYACVILARLLGINPIEVVAANELVTEKRQERREIWQSIMNEAEAQMLAAETKTAPAKEPSENMVVRGRIELPTRGFSERSNV